MKIVIVESQLLVRETLRLTCNQFSDCKVVGETHSGKESVGLILQTKPDVVFLDVHLQDISGFSVIEVLRHAGSPAKIFLMSSFCDHNTVYHAERARVHGFLEKATCAVDTLRKALIAADKGKPFFSEAYSQAQAHRRQDPKAFDKILSNCEQRLLALVGQLLSDEQISCRLGITEQTVEKHRSNIRRKLCLTSTSELLRYARDYGFMRPTMAGIGNGSLLETAYP